MTKKNESMQRRIPKKKSSAYTPPKTKPRSPLSAEMEFREIAMHGNVASKDKDGAMRVLIKPQRRRDFEWHGPHVFVPERQWRPATGITRYEFARRETPAHQRELFERLQFRFQVEGPPTLASEDVWKRVAEARSRGGSLPNGLPGEDLGDELRAEVGRHMIREYSPDGQWSFMAQAVSMGDGLIGDRLDVRHRDYRTLADWTLLVRFRAWVLPDTREAVMLMPGMDIHKEGWQNRYENATPNNLQLISPRY